MRRAVLTILLAFSTASFAQVEIPAGTVLPIMLNSAIRSDKSNSGQMLKATIMQDVSLGIGSTIREGSTLTGRVMKVTRATATGGATVSLRFDMLTLANSDPVLASVLHHWLFERKAPKRTISITAHLRALASAMEVREAQEPEATVDQGNPATTVQVGGDVVYWGGGPVTNSGFGVVGKPVYHGVLSPLAPNAERGCVAGNNRPQALWVFSSDACGAYGWANLKIAESNSDRVGEITLTTDHAALNIRRGSGMLLVVDSSKG